MTNSQVNQPMLLPKTNTEVMDRMTLQKAVRAAASISSPQIGGFVLDPNASIKEICQDIVDYAHNYMVIDKIAMTSIIDPTSLGSNVREDLIVDSNLAVIVRSLENALRAGKAKSHALRDAVILLDMGNGTYLVIDGNHRYFAVKQLKWNLMPKAAVLPYKFFETHGIEKEIFQCDCNPQPENAGMKLGELLGRVETNWFGVFIQGSKERAFDWIQGRNLGAFNDKTLKQRLNGIQKRVNAKKAAAKNIAAAHAATTTQPNFYNWSAGTDLASRARAFNTHEFIDANCQNILVNSAKYYSLNASDSAMQSKVLGTMINDLKSDGTHLKDIIIGEYSGNPVNRVDNVGFLNLTVPAEKTMKALKKARKDALKRLLDSIDSAGFPFDEIYFLPQAAGIECQVTPIKAWSRAGGFEPDFK